MTATFSKLRSPCLEDVYDPTVNVGVVCQRERGGRRRQRAVVHLGAMENVFFSILIAIFLAVGLSIVVLFPAYDQARKAEKKKTDTANAAVKTARELTIEEVAKHNAESDCWLIVKNKVYDVSSYVNDHPGGEAILNNAGGENTKGFFGPQHPRWAYERIEEYYIGDIVQ